MELSREFITVWASLFGLVVGSFLNVAIYRLPLEGQSVSRPRRSRCPQCGTELSWRENIPLVSWLVQRGRCKGCACRIPVRYPMVELLTAVLWGLAAWIVAAGAPMMTLERFGLLAIYVLVLSGLIVATFVDFDHFEIPDEVSIGGMVLAPVLSFLVPLLHADTHVAQMFSSGAEVDRTGSFLGSLAGVLVGGGILLAMGWLGKKLYQRDAMGLGDVKLLAAGGGFVGPGGALVALLIGSLVASVVGILNMARFLCLTRARARQRKARKSFGQALRVARIAGRYLPFGPYLGIGIGIVLLDWNDVLRLWKELVF